MRFEDFQYMALVRFSDSYLDMVATPEGRAIQKQTFLLLENISFDNKGIPLFIVKTARRDKFRVLPAHVELVKQSNANQLRKLNELLIEGLERAISALIVAKVPGHTITNFRCLVESAEQKLKEL